MKVGCDVSNYLLVEPFSFTIAYADPNIAEKRVGENNTQLFSLHWPVDYESIVTSIVDSTILSIVNVVIAGLPDPSRRIQDLCSCLEEPNGDGGLYTHNVTSIFDNNTAARWGKVAMKLSNPTLFCVVYRGQQANSTDGA